jgi:hypothetical protein
VGGTYYVGKKMMGAFTKDPAAITAISQNVAGSATVPAGYTQVAGVDFGVFSFKAKGVILQKGGDPKAGGTVIAYGALTAKPQEKAALRDSLEKAMQGATGGGQAQQQRQVVSQEEVDMQVGSETQKVLHIISTDQQGGNKQSQYFVFLDGWNNEFGWLGVGAMGPDDKFDLDGFKAFLASLKK